MLLIFVAPLMFGAEQQGISIATDHCAGRCAPLESAQQEQNQNNN
jgi:hypothetical protein